LHSLCKDAYKSEMFARWIKETKGKKMVTSLGFFKKLQLFALRSKWDSKEKAKEHVKQKHFRYFAGKLSKLRFNFHSDVHYKKHEKKYLYKNVYLKYLPTCFTEITGFADKFDKFLNQNVSPLEVEQKLESWAKTAWLEQEMQNYIDDLCQTPEDYVPPNMKEEFLQEIEKDLSQAFEITPEWIEEINEAFFGKESPPPLLDDWSPPSMEYNLNTQLKILYT